MGSLKIAIVVHGRFHAFGLAAALAELGNDVTIFTNYPRSLSDGEIPAGVQVETFWAHFIRSRLWRFPSIASKLDSVERYLKEFGTWAEQKLRGQYWDVIYSWSSVSKEILESEKVKARCKLVARGSTHILFQDGILREEGERTGIPIERPCKVTIERELFEYDRADAVVVLSSFCKKTFLDKGVDASRIVLMVPGCNLARFAADGEVLADRQKRIAEGGSLRVITVGTFSQRKGALDYCGVVESLVPRKFAFRFVGSVSDDARIFASRLGSKIEWVKRSKQSSLPSHFAWGDIFFYPTLEEGFPQSTMQAFAAGLPVVTSENGAARDLKSVGAKCWEMPIRNVDGTVRLLSDLESDRVKLLGQHASEQIYSRGWNLAAADLLRAIKDLPVATSGAL